MALESCNFVERKVNSVGNNEWVNKCRRRSDSWPHAHLRVWHVPASSGPGVSLHWPQCHGHKHQSEAGVGRWRPQSILYLLYSQYRWVTSTRQSPGQVRAWGWSLPAPGGGGCVTSAWAPAWRPGAHAASPRSGPDHGARGINPIQSPFLLQPILIYPSPERICYCEWNHIWLVVQPHSNRFLVSWQKIFDIWWVQIKSLISKIISKRGLSFF